MTARPRRTKAGGAATRKAPDPAAMRRRAETAAAQLRRLLNLIPELADGEEHRITEMARLANVTPALLLSDLNALVDRYDVPAGWVDAVSICIDRDHVSVHSEQFLRPMRLTMPELCALELGLMLAERERPESERHAIRSALARLREAITQLPANDQVAELRAADATAIGSEHLPVLRAAQRDCRKVRLRYRAGSVEESSDRVVCPYTTAFVHGSWYAVAHCERSDGLRFFRVDRIEAAELLAETFERPASFSAAEVFPEGRAFAHVSGASSGASGVGSAMTVCYSPRIARWIAEREGCALADDGSLTLTHPLADEEWAMRHVLQYGPDAEVLDPPELRALLADRLRGIVAALGLAGAGPTAVDPVGVNPRGVGSAGAAHAGVAPRAGA